MLPSNNTMQYLWIFNFFLNSYDFIKFSFSICRKNVSRSNIFSCRFGFFFTPFFFRYASRAGDSFFYIVKNGRARQGAQSRPFKKVIPSKLLSTHSYTICCLITPPPFLKDFSAMTAREKNLALFWISRGENDKISSKKFEVNNTPPFLRMKVHFHWEGCYLATYCI